MPFELYICDCSDTLTHRSFSAFLFFWGGASVHSSIIPTHQCLGKVLISLHCYHSNLLCHSPPQRTDTFTQWGSARSIKWSQSATWYDVTSRLMFDTSDDQLKKRGGGRFTDFEILTGVRATHRRPDAVSTLLICPDHIELYGVQQLSGAVAPLEEKQKR